MTDLEMTPLQINFTKKLQYQMERTGKGTTEIAAYFGIKAPSVNGWLKTGRVGKERLSGLAEIFGTSLDYWMLERMPESEGGGAVVSWNTDADLPADETRVWVDRWDYSCSAGNGQIQWEIRQKSALPFTEAFFKAIGARPEHCRLMSVRGTSMEPFLFDKDMMMVDITKTSIRDGEVYAICFENEPLVKRIYKQGAGVLVLNSYNTKNFPDKLVDPATVGQFQVIGEVIYRSGSGFKGS